jgi:hypothetical protein
MYVIVADYGDDSAVRLAELWRSEGAVLMTPRDLSFSGWSVFPDDAGRSVFVAGGATYRAAEIDGVVVRLACVSEADLVHIVAEDRIYAAAEMTAFLLAWLSGLPVPVVNKPTACSLCGPTWQREKWVHEAARLGIAVRNRSMAIKFGDGAALGELDSEPTVTVSVVGGRCVDACDPVLADAAVRLAHRAGAALLAVRFSHSEADRVLVDAHPWPDMSRADIAAALLSYLRRTARANSYL